MIFVLKFLKLLYLFLLSSSIALSQLAPQVKLSLPIFGRKPRNQASRSLPGESPVVTHINNVNAAILYCHQRCILYAIPMFLVSATIALNPNFAPEKDLFHVLDWLLVS